MADLFVQISEDAKANKVRHDSAADERMNWRQAVVLFTQDMNADLQRS